jgi:hypothetical protein
MHSHPNIEGRRATIGGRRCTVPQLGTHFKANQLPMRRMM